MLGSMMGGGMGGGGGQKKAIQMDQNYNFPIIALKALTQTSPATTSSQSRAEPYSTSHNTPKGSKC